MIISSEPVKIPEIRAFFEIISGHKFRNRNCGHVREIPVVWQPQDIVYITVMDLAIAANEAQA